MADAVLTRGALSRTSLLAAALAFGGLPLYVHLPRFYAEQMALGGLPALGAVLLAARAFDSFQDPVIGWLADRWRGWREIWAIVGMALLASGFLILFAPPDWGAPLPRLAIGLFAAFTGFSALQIAIYDHGLALADNVRGAHTRVALWREAGGLGGICLAAMAPAVLATTMGPAGAFLGFALLFLAVAASASLVMAGHWRASGSVHAGPGSFRRALATPGILPMLGFGFVNALPTAVTSTLFLFFVSHVLEAEEHAGPLLLLFFAAAASASPGWARLADRFGRRITLASAMSLSIVAFAWAYLLGPGDVAPFYVVAIASGAALGADMTLAPAMLAAQIEDDGGRGRHCAPRGCSGGLCTDGAGDGTGPCSALGRLRPGAVSAQTHRHRRTWLSPIRKGNNSCRNVSSFWPSRWSPVSRDAVRRHLRIIPAVSRSLTCARI
jgi:GPH family glycoside/pentoside/hexuronide:cation symporter